MPQVLLSEWIFVDESGATRPTRQRPDANRRQRPSEGPDDVPRSHSGPARPRRVRHERDGRICAHLSDARVARDRAEALENAGQSPVAAQVPRSRQLLRPDERARRPGAHRRPAAAARQRVYRRRCARVRQASITSRSGTTSASRRSCSATRGWTRTASSCRSMGYDGMRSAHARCPMVRERLALSRLSLIRHEPVMVAEVLEHLAPSRGGMFVDCTVGLGGHARALLEAGASRLIGLDRDPAALAHARTALREFGDRVELVHSDYRRLNDVLDAARRHDGRRRARGSRCVVDAARLAGTRVQLPAGRSAGHADGHDDGTDGRRGDSRCRRADAGRRDLRVRRGAAFAAHRAGDRRGAATGADRDDRAARRRRAARDSAQGVLADRSGDADVPGDSHLGEPRARGARHVSRRRRAAARRRTGGWR